MCLYLGRVCKAARQKVSGQIAVCLSVAIGKSPKVQCLSDLKNLEVAHSSKLNENGRRAALSSQWRLAHSGRCEIVAIFLSYSYATVWLHLCHCTPTVCGPFCSNSANGYRIYIRSTFTCKSSTVRHVKKQCQTAILPTCHGHIMMIPTC